MGRKVPGAAGGKKLPPRKPIGEAWEVWDETVVSEGPLKGRSLRELVKSDWRALLGTTRRPARFPLLVKLLDARDRLSVQVHPDDSCAAAMGLPYCGKTEAWYVLHAEPGVRMVTGLKKALGLSQLRQLAASREIARYLRMAEVKSGQVWLCPAGAVHALGPGALLLEVQQNSDATFRLHDWGRVGLDGKPRRLHLTESVRAIGRRPVSLRRCTARKLRGLPFPASRRVACDKFVLDEWKVRTEAARVKANAFEILHVAAGAGTLRDGRGRDVSLTRGRTVLVPACVAEYRIVPRRPLTLLRAAEPE